MREETYGELEIYIGYNRLSVRDLSSYLLQVNRLYGLIASALEDPNMDQVTFKHFKHYNELEIIDFEKGSLKVKTVANKAVIFVVGAALSGVIGNYVYDLLKGEIPFENNSIVQEKIINKATDLYRDVNRNNDIKEFSFTYTDSKGVEQKIEIKTKR